MTTIDPSTEQRQYLISGGWLENIRGWWHPPSCLASWPLPEAYKMAKRDEERGLRMTTKEASITEPAK